MLPSPSNKPATQAISRIVGRRDAQRILVHGQSALPSETKVVEASRRVGYEVIVGEEFRTVVP